MPSSGRSTQAGRREDGRLLIGPAHGWIPDQRRARQADISPVRRKRAMGSSGVRTRTTISRCLVLALASVAGASAGEWRTTGLAQTPPQPAPPAGPPPGPDSQVQPGDADRRGHQGGVRPEQGLSGHVARVLGLHPEAARSREAGAGDGLPGRPAVQRAGRLRQPDSQEGDSADGRRVRHARPRQGADAPTRSIA